MRKITVLLMFLLAACAPAEKESYTVTTDVDLEATPALLAAVNAVTDNDIPVGELLALTNSVPMDQEKQQRFDVTYKGVDTDLLYHVWREQSDWVHLYATSTSEELIGAVDGIFSEYSRPEDD